MKVRRIDIVKECTSRLERIHNNFPRDVPELLPPKPPIIYCFGIRWDAKDISECQAPTCCICKEVEGWVDG